jgi:RNA polymerase sigma-70 factor (ECF subfamily)
VVAVADTRQQLFEQIAAEIAEPVRRYALRRTDPDTADDVLADTLLVVWRRLDDVPADGRLPWCYAVAAKSLANLNRSARRQRNVADRIVRLDPPRDVTDAIELADPDLHRALAKLRSEDQELLRLWAWEDLSPSEIAVAIGTSPNAVRIRLHRARRRLAAVLGGEMSSPRADRE